MEVKTLSASQIKAEALRLGFSACGMAPAEPVNTAIADAFSRWQAQGMQANMNYMGNYLDKRLDPRLLMEGVRTILSVALNIILPGNYGKTNTSLPGTSMAKTITT